MKWMFIAAMVFVSTLSHSDESKDKRKPTSQLETIEVGPGIKATVYYYKQSRGVEEVITVFEDSKNNTVCYLRNDRGGLSCIKK